MYVGIPSQLLTNRPDIRQAEYELQAAKLDTQSSQANFYPSFTLRAGVGFRSLSRPNILLQSPESLLYTV